MPEQIAVVSIAFAIAKLPFRWREIIPMGILLAFTAYGVRLFPLPFGTHTLILIFILFIVLTLKVKGDVSLSLVACLLSYSAMFVFELVCLSILMAVFKVSNDTLFNNQLIRVLFTEPQVVLLFSTAFLIRRKRVTHD